MSKRSVLTFVVAVFLPVFLSGCITEDEWLAKNYSIVRMVGESDQEWAHRKLSVKREIAEINALRAAKSAQDAADWDRINGPQPPLGLSDAVRSAREGLEDYSRSLPSTQGSTLKTQEAIRKHQEEERRRKRGW